MRPRRTADSPWRGDVAPDLDPRLTMRDARKPLTMHDRARLSRALRGWALYGREADEWKKIGPAQFYLRKRLGLRVCQVRPIQQSPPPFHLLLINMGITPPPEGDGGEPGEIWED